MKNEEKKEIKKFKKQYSGNQDQKKIIENNKKNIYSHYQEEKSMKNIKNPSENQKIPKIKNNEPSIYKLSENKKNNNSNFEDISKNVNKEQIQIPNVNNVNVNVNVNNNNENKEPDNSFESKMFYEVNSKNIMNFNTPVKTINVYRNNFFNYTNNNLLSNLLCDVSDDNKNVMVSELDLNISNKIQKLTLEVNLNQILLKY